MPNNFLSENFLLESDHAIELYHRYARDLPIVDFHCHLPPADIAQDRRFENLTQIWLAGDHYKWRAMRAAGVDERFCTGAASDWDKFQKWAETVPKTLRNPLYHWTHLELKRPLGIADRRLNARTASEIWDRGNAVLASEGFSSRGIMRQMKVVLVYTTDDPTDTLAHHAAIAADPTESIRVLPTFRPDRALAVESPTDFNAWVDRLAGASGVEIGDDFSQFLAALHARHDFFHAAGCRLSDHGMERVDMAAPDGTGSASVEVGQSFARIRGGQTLDAGQIAEFRAVTLHELALWNHGKGWTQQFHIGALRNNNSRMFQRLGPDSGFDSIGDGPLARPLVALLDGLDRTDQLAPTIVYNLNPAANETIATMLGNFQDGRMPGKMQFGSGWWFLDQRDGIQRQLDTLSNLGLLSTFLGMVTDSRSFLSYTRHEYFRRILCNLLGGEMEKGLLPDDLPLVGGVVSDICYRNAARRFGCLA